MATSLPTRTFDLALLGGDGSSANAGAADPATSATGTIVAFDSPAGARSRNVYAVNVVTGTKTLISAAPGGAPANGDSTAPSVSSDGSTIAFVSTASNLAPGASPTHANVYVRLPSGRIELVSGAVGGGVADGASGQPAVSGNGQFVAFTSSAGNLVPGERNHSTDVFIRNLATERTILVSVGRAGASANGWSSNPSISATGRYVSFDSAATNLPGSPHTRVANVFVRDTVAGRTDLISVTSGGVPQNRAVAPPFHQISSISADGRYVAFDSDADNLVRGDLNRRTDVFVRDRRRHTTILISENNAGFEGNSDSFAPTISADGTKVAFESFASNLAPGGGPRENVFVRDLSLRMTSVIDVGANGQRPLHERVAELLQRPVLSADGSVAVFESTAANLTDDASAQTHVFLRLMAPAVASFVKAPPAHVRSSQITLLVNADDPTASTFACQLDAGTPFACRPGAIRFSDLRPGRHSLSIRAGGPGLLYDPAALDTTVSVIR